MYIHLHCSLVFLHHTARFACSLIRLLPYAFPSLYESEWMAVFAVFFLFWTIVERRGKTGERVKGITAEGDEEKMKHGTDLL